MNDKIGELLGALAAKLGTTIDHLWGVLVSQVHNKAIKNCLLYFFVVLFAVSGSIVFKRLFNKYKNNSDAKENIWFGFGVFSIIVFVFIVAILATMDTTLAMFNNPEYIALKDVLSMIGGK